MKTKPCPTCETMQSATPAGEIRQSEHQAHGFSEMGDGAHTPEPWIHRHNYICTPDGEIIATAELQVRETDGPGQQTGSIAYMERDCNAELIASAPRLLREHGALRDALKLVLDRIDQQHQEELTDWTDDAAEIFNQARALL